VDRSAQGGPSGLLIGFPISPFGLDPPRIVGIISLAMLAIAISAICVFGLDGPWRWLYVVAATVSLYLNSFVGVAQSFQECHS
jgi:hypothetical protein